MMTTEEKAGKIIKDVQKEKGANPVRTFRSIASKEYVNIHGPEHHVLDGICILTDYCNAGGKSILRKV